MNSSDNTITQTWITSIISKFSENEDDGYRYVKKSYFNFTVFFPPRLTE